MLLERERLRQLRLHALERAAEELSRRGEHGQALDAALSCVRLEPLRETGHAAVLRIHLVEGNLSEALRHYDGYRALLRAELGLAPSAQMTSLVQRWLTPPPRTAAQRAREPVLRTSQPAAGPAGSAGVRPAPAPR